MSRAAPGATPAQRSRASRTCRRETRAHGSDGDSWSCRRPRAPGRRLHGQGCRAGGGCAERHGPSRPASRAETAGPQRSSSPRRSHHAPAGVRGEQIDTTAITVMVEADLHPNGPPVALEPALPAILKSCMTRIEKPVEFRAPVAQQDDCLGSKRGRDGAKRVNAEAPRAATLDMHQRLPRAARSCRELTLRKAEPMPERADDSPEVDVIHLCSEGLRRGSSATEARRGPPTPAGNRGRRTQGTLLHAAPPPLRASCQPPDYWPLTGVVLSCTTGRSPRTPT